MPVSYTHLDVYKRQVQGTAAYPPCPVWIQSGAASAVNNVAQYTLLTVQACDSITPYSTIKSKKKQGKSARLKNFVAGALLLSMLFYVILFAGGILSS